MRAAMTAHRRRMNVTRSSAALVLTMWALTVSHIVTGALIVTGHAGDGAAVVGAVEVFGRVVWAFVWFVPAAAAVWGMLSTELDRWRPGMAFMASATLTWAMALSLSGVWHVAPTTAVAHLAIAASEAALSALAIEPRVRQAIEQAR